MYTLDQSLHEQLMEEGFSSDLLNLLRPLFDSSTPSSTAEDGLISIASPCIQSLCLLANSSGQLRQELRNNSKLLLGLLKGLYNDCSHAALSQFSKGFSR